MRWNLRLCKTVEHGWWGSPVFLCAREYTFRTFHARIRTPDEWLLETVDGKFFPIDLLNRMMIYLPWNVTKRYWDFTCEFHEIWVSLFNRVQNFWLSPLKYRFKESKRLLAAIHKLVDIFLKIENAQFWQRWDAAKCWPAKRFSLERLYCGSQIKNCTFYFPNKQPFVSEF